MKSGLPEVAGAGMAGVGVLGIAAVDAAEEHRQGVGMLRNHNKMNVIGHKAPSQDANAAVALAFAHEVEVDTAVGNGAEDDLAIGAPLGDMVGESGDHVAGVARHTN